jgi:hypothetical protein
MLHLAFHKLTHIRSERVIAVCLWLTILVSLCTYGYFIVSSVVHVMLRQELMVNIQNAEAHVSSLEADYLSRTEQMSEKYVTEIGLVKIASITYIPLGSDERLSRLP